jgi:hypothetical protein
MAADMLAGPCEFIDCPKENEAMNTHTTSEELT